VVNGDFAVNGNISLGGDIELNDATIYDNGNITTSGNITVNAGNITVNTNITGTTGGTVKANYFYSNGDIHADGNLSISGDIDASGSSVEVNEIEASGDITAEGNIVAGSISVRGGDVILDEGGCVKASSFAKLNGTSSQFLKADGSVDSSNYAGSQSAGGPANKTVSIPFGEVDSTSTATAFTATVDGITELRNGICVFLRNGVINSASGYTININNLGAKVVYNSKSGNRSTDAFTNGSSYLFVYNSTRISVGCWDMVMGYYENDTDTDYRAYQIRTNSQSLPASAIIHSRRLLFTSADGSKYVPANTTNSTYATTKKTPTTTKINPFGTILYYNSTSDTSSDATPSSTILYQQINI